MSFEYICTFILYGIYMQYGIRTIAPRLGLGFGLGLGLVLELGDNFPLGQLS